MHSTNSNTGGDEKEQAVRSISKVFLYFNAICTNYFAIFMQFEML